MELLQALDRFLAENVKDVSVDAQAVLAHVIRPPSYEGVSSDRGTGGSKVLFEPVQPVEDRRVLRCEQRIKKGKGRSTGLAVMPIVRAARPARSTPSRHIASVADILRAASVRLVTWSFFRMLCT